MKLHLIYVLKTHHVGSTIQEMQLQAKFLLWRDFPNDVQAPSSFGRFRFKVSVCCPIFLSFYLSVYSVHPSPIQHWKVKIRGLIKDPWSKRNGLSRIIMSYFSKVLSFILCSFLSPPDHCATPVPAVPGTRAFKLKRRRQIWDSLSTLQVPKPNMRLGNPFITYW